MTETYLVAGVLAIFGGVALVRAWRRERRGSRRSSDGYSDPDGRGGSGDGWGGGDSGCGGGGCGGGGGD